MADLAVDPWTEINCGADSKHEGHRGDSKHDCKASVARDCEARDRVAQPYLNRFGFHRHHLVRMPPM